MESSSKARTVRGCDDPLGYDMSDYDAAARMIADVKSGAPKRRSRPSLSVSSGRTGESGNWHGGMSAWRDACLLVTAKRSPTSDMSTPFLLRKDGIFCYQ